jgi:hypothetical protein
MFFLGSEHTKINTTGFYFLKFYICVNHGSNYVLVCVNNVPNYVLVCVKSCFKMLYLKLCLNGEEGKKEEKNASPRWSRPQTQTDARTKTVIFASAARRKRTLADIKMRRAAGDALRLLSS